MPDSRLRLVACTLSMALLSACVVDTVRPVDERRALTNSISGLTNISADEPIHDPGPFPITPSTWYSRCPDTETLQTAKWISLDNPKIVSIENPDNPNKPLVVFEIPLKDLKFYDYINKAFPTSQANYRLAREILSNDQHWAIPYEGSVTMKCTGGVYTPSPFNSLVAEYVGSLAIIQIWDVRRTNLADDALPPAEPACDDPLTELEETPPDCAPGPPFGTSGGGSSHGEVIHISYPGGGAPLRFMCDVTDWYEWRNNRWEYVDTQIHWNTCGWE